MAIDARKQVLQGEIRKLQKDVADRDAKLEETNKQLVWLRNQKFGDKGEQGRKNLAD